MSDQIKKKSIVSQILSRIKAFLFKYFGRGRWYALGLLLTFFLSILNAMNDNTNAEAEGVTSDQGTYIREMALANVSAFSVGADGTAVVFCDFGKDGLGAVWNLDTGEVRYAKGGGICVDFWKGDRFWAKDYAVTEDDAIYARMTEYDDYYNNRFILKESIVRITKDYQYMDCVCEIPYDTKQRDSRLSKMHYANGTVTFAETGEDYVRLYSIDTASKALRISRDYPTDADGTYTVQVIPVDEGFLFLRSDGNIYKVGFDEPLGESVAHFSVTGAEGSIPYFTQAVKCDEQWYVFNENDPATIWAIYGNVAKPVLTKADFAGHEESAIRFLEKKKIQGSEKQELVICLTDGLYTYSDGILTDQNVIVKTQIGPYYYLYHVMLVFSSICQWGLIINLIIRKKTLFYKQMLITVPVFMIISVTISVKLYDDMTEQNKENIRDELDIICGFGIKELEGYDFSELMEAGEATGAAYEKINEVFRSINTNHSRPWSEDYVFEVIYREDDTNAKVLAYDDKKCMPMTVHETFFPDEVFESGDGNGTLYIAEIMTNFLSYDAKKSEISAYGKIHDAGDSGRLYLRVSTINNKFWYQRRQLLISIGGFAIALMGIITLILLLTSLYITRAIRKTTGVVKRISDGDLKARINYKAKDELGEICNEVNAMGNNLEEMFEEKDRTEHFYYKFVPEQFRELLGKEKFTDLALGDSSSRELTVLFCDIRSFSINSEIMTAKENFEFVNIIYGIAGPIIRENGGFVDKYIGDAVMALFENADDAVKSGIEIYRAIVLDPHTAERLGISDINIGIGIHSGMARVGIVGESERLSGTVISDTVNLSSRLESLTKQYQTAMLISKDTVDRMSDPDTLELRYLGSVQVAGVNEVKGLYEVLDCLPEEERKKRNANTVMLREAIRLFHLGRRRETLEMLQSISFVGRGDHVTEMYLDYVKTLSEEDKGNVFRFVRK